MGAPDGETRELRVVVCRACRWQYGSWWLRTTPVDKMDCPRCGAPTTVEGAFLPEHRAVSAGGVHGQGKLDL